MHHPRDLHLRPTAISFQKLVWSCGFASITFSFVSHAPLLTALTTTDQSRDLCPAFNA